MVVEAYTCGDTSVYLDAISKAGRKVQIFASQAPSQVAKFWSWPPCWEVALWGCFATGPPCSPPGRVPCLRRRHVLAGELALHHRERDARTAVDGGVLDAKAATCGVAGGKEAGDGTVVLAEHLAVAVYLGISLLVCSVTFYAYVLVAPAGPAPDARCVSAQSAVWHRIPVV